jgi:glycosyltransferase involved in cell wall biosynthesis
MINQIVDKVSFLIENDSLRMRMGQNAKRLIEEGEFSAEKRNERLRRIFGEALDVN